MFTTNRLLNKLFKGFNIYFFTIDHLFKKIVIFSGKYILEISLVDKGGSIKKSKYFYFYIRKFEDIYALYNFVNGKDNYILNNYLSSIINYFISNEELIYNIFYKENLIYFKNTFSKINLNKKILFILRGGGMEETIEKSFISYCNNSNLDLTVLYKFGTGYWGQQLNQEGFFNELKANNKNVKFLYNEDFDDNFIDSIVDNNTEIFSFQYDYKGKYSNLNMIILSSVSNGIIDLSKYKNIFSCYHSNNIGYSTDKFTNIENTNIYKIFNPQNINLLRNYSIITKIDDFILSGGMSWARDFSKLNLLKGKYKGIIISDELQKVENFLSFYRGIQSYYGFLGVFILSKMGFFCHLEKFNDDDRSKMIATSICAGKAVFVPYNNGLIVNDIINYQLGLTYNNLNKEYFIDNFEELYGDKNEIANISNNCKIYSDNNMDVNSFINFIFSKIQK